MNPVLCSELFLSVLATLSLQILFFLASSSQNVKGCHVISMLFVPLALWEHLVAVSSNFKAALFNLIVKKHFCIRLFSLQTTLTLLQC